MRFATLNEALNAGHPDCIALWPLGLNIAYNSTERVLVETGALLGKRQVPEMRLISVYRDERGLYEEAITYITT